MTARAMRSSGENLGGSRLESTAWPGGSACCVCALAQYLREQASDDPIVPAERSGKA
jgi:hypothetical protein